MKKSMSSCHSYCQLLRQWARFSCRQRPGVPFTACRLKSTTTPQCSSASQIWHGKMMTPGRQFCTAAEEVAEDEDSAEPVQSVPLTRERINIAANFRTENDDPLKHTHKDEGLFYRVPAADYEKYVSEGQWPRYKSQVKTFQESSIMVRGPALEIFDYIDNYDLNFPPLRVLLYGKNGTGKTLTLAHVVHRYANAGWLTLHLPNVLELIRFRKTRPRAYAMSTYKEGLYDYTDDAVWWLQYFKTQNESHIQGIKTTKECKWSQREKSLEGTELLEIIEFGISRKKYASDCIGVIIREIKLQAAEKGLKVLVAVDGVNGFWRSIHFERKLEVNAQKVSFFQHFQKLFEQNWSSAVCVGTVCATVDAVDIKERDRDTVPYTPHYLLKKKGFEFMDPFIPVLVPEYSMKESRNCIDYYIERKWIIKPRGLTEEGKKELQLLSNNNPLELMNTSISW